MFIIEVKFCGEWSLVCRCVVPHCDRTEFMDAETSSALLRFYRSRTDWPVRLRRVWELL